jgi:hypothetical protein
MSVPWEDDARQARQLCDQAQEALEANRTGEAAALFRQAYDLNPEPFPAARYIHCLRRQGAEQAQLAVAFARQPVQRWPSDQWLMREYVWAIYEGYLKAGPEAEEAEESSADAGRGFDLRLKAARRITVRSSGRAGSARAGLASG